MPEHPLWRGEPDMAQMVTTKRADMGEVQTFMIRHHQNGRIHTIQNSVPLHHHTDPFRPFKKPNTGRDRSYELGSNDSCPILASTS